MTDTKVKTYKLYDNQEKHVQEMEVIYKKYKRVLNLSMCGVGKTLCAFELAKRLNMKILALAPLSVVENAWYWHMKEYPELRNYCIGAHCYDSFKSKNKGFVEDDKKGGLKATEFLRELIVKYNILFVFDEISRGKDNKTLLSKSLVAIIEAVEELNVGGIVLLSGTPFDFIENSETFLRYLSIYTADEIIEFGGSKITNRKGYNEIINKCSAINKTKTDKILNTIKLTNKESVNTILYELLYNIIIPEYSSYIDGKINIDIRNSFMPMNDKEYEFYYTYMQKLEKAYVQYGDQGIIGSGLVNVLREFEMVGLYLFIDRIIQLLKNPKNKIVVFLNYLDTLYSFNEEMEKMGIEYETIYGEKTEKQRIKSIEQFQHNNKCRVITLQMETGSYGLSLDDKIGGDEGFTRYSLISSCTFKFLSLLQAFFRTSRANTKSKAYVEIMYGYNKSNRDKNIENILKLGDKDKINSILEKRYDYNTEIDLITKMIGNDVKIQLENIIEKGTRVLNNWSKKNKTLETIDACKMLCSYISDIKDYILD